MKKLGWRVACVFLSVLGAGGCSGASASAPADRSGGDSGVVAPPPGDMDGGSVVAPADGGDAAAPSQGPIVAPPDTWTWVDFPDSKCASGTATGIGVNPHAGADSVVIYLEGGGGCTTASSCWGPNPSAHSLDGYDAAKFAQTTQLKFPLLSRSNANPLAGANMVFVPYCTGDLHSGTATVDLTLDGKTIPTYFWGARNLQAYLARLAPTFKNTTRVYLAGGSAGGFGTVIDFDLVAQAFGVRVDVIDDSGPPITQKGSTTNAALGLWGYAAPAGCSDCTSLPRIFAYDRQKQPGSRFGLLSFAQDPTISHDFGYTLDEYPGVLDAFAASIASDPNAATFVVTNSVTHVVQSKPTLAPQYLPWVKQMITDSSDWKNATYAAP